MSLICWLSVYLLPDLQGFPGSVREGFTADRNSQYLFVSTKQLSLVADSEFKVLCSLSATKPNSPNLKPMFCRSYGGINVCYLFPPFVTTAIHGPRVLGEALYFDRSISQLDRRSVSVRTCDDRTSETGASSVPDET